MQIEDIEEVNNGKWPAEYYHTANTEKELAELINSIQWGWLIDVDDKTGQGFSFGIPEVGKVAFSSGSEFLDEDEEIENPDFQVRQFSSALEGVRSFKIKGKPLIEVVRGCRFFQSDMPMPY